MSRISQTKTSFTSGEIDPALYGRIDLRAYEEGAATLTNVLVKRTGGISRRPGSEFLASVPNGLKLFSYGVGEVQELLVFGDQAVHVVADGTTPFSIASAELWPIADVPDLNISLVDDAVLVCHKDHEPRLLRRGPTGQWTHAPLRFARLNADDGDERVAMPFARFAPAEVAIQVVPGPDQADPTMGRDVSVELRTMVVGADGAGPYVDYPLDLSPTSIIRVKGRQLEVGTTITDVETGQPIVLARTLEPLVDTLATVDWDEQAFGDVHGWPIAAAMHQNRLVLAGCRDRPDYLWFSRSGRPFDFDMAQGEDDAAIAFRLGGERRHEIRQLSSGRVLQVFTTAGEWTVQGHPLTPRTARIELQTHVGSLADRQVQPVDVDGATLFVGGTGRDLREFLFTDTEQAYQAADIAILSRHLLQDPVDMAFDRARRVFWIVRADGRFCAVTIDRNSNIVAWTLQETSGSVRAVAVHDGDLVVLVERDALLAVERLADDVLLDSTRRQVADSPAESWGNLEHLVGRQVYLIVDGETFGEVALQAAQIQLPGPATRVDAGLAFTHTVEGLPLVAGSGRGVSLDAPYRPVRIGMRLGPSKALLLDSGSGMRPVSFGRSNGLNEVFDVSLRARGWRRGTSASPWRLAQSEPGIFDLLSVTVEAKVNG